MLQMKILTTALITILLTRISVAIAVAAPSLHFIFYDQTYHLYYGLALMVLAVAIKFWNYALILFGIGIGLFIDDIAALTYILGYVSENPLADYWSALFILPLLMSLLILTLSEKKLENIFQAYKTSSEINHEK